jgi:hypothetical protein
MRATTNTISRSRERCDVLFMTGLLEVAINMAVPHHTLTRSCRGRRRTASRGSEAILTPCHRHFVFENSRERNDQTGETSTFDR